MGFEALTPSKEKIQDIKNAESSRIFKFHISCQKKALFGLSIENYRFEYE
jgi:hypothetical protein